jgi:membrane-associated phospholipid phosphatase
LSGRSEWTALGTWSVEALVVSDVATTLIKGVVGRTRPYAAAGDPDVYKLARGFGNNAFASFPSGHVSASFAVATVMDKGTADASPRTHRVVTAIAYGLATVVGLSRMYTNEYWASDVVAGAAIGFTSGLAVVRRGHARRDRPLGAGAESALTHFSISPTSEGGFMLGFSAR